MRINLKEARLIKSDRVNKKKLKAKKEARVT